MNHSKKIKFKTIKKYLESFSIEFQSDVSDDMEFIGINSLINASQEEITFLTNKKYLDNVYNIKAKVCFVNNDNLNLLPSNCIPVIVSDPYFCLACLSNLFKISEKSNGIINKNVEISNKAKIDRNVQIDQFSSIHDQSYIKSNVIIGPNCNIGPNVIINEDTVINSNVTLSNCIIGLKCIVKSGAVIGGEGFGFDEKSKISIKHFGNVVIGDSTIIGSNTTIDRAVFDSTIISEFSNIDNLVQIAHNVIIGKHAIIAAQVGIAGSTKIGNFVKIGGQAGISGHLKIGDNVTIAGKSGVTKNLKDKSIVAGFPAIDIKKWKMNILKINKKL